MGGGVWVGVGGCSSPIPHHETHAPCLASACKLQTRISVSALPQRLCNCSYLLITPRSTPHTPHTSHLTPPTLLLPPNLLFLSTHSPINTEPSLHTRTNPPTHPILPSLAHHSYAPTANAANLGPQHPCTPYSPSALMERRLGEQHGAFSRAKVASAAGVGGPTLVTEQHAHREPFCRRGWGVLAHLVLSCPEASHRLLYFNQSLQSQ